MTGSGIQPGDRDDGKTDGDADKSEYPQNTARDLAHASGHAFDSLGSDKVRQTLDNEGKAKSGNKYVPFKLHGGRTVSIMPLMVQQGQQFNFRFQVFKPFSRPFPLVTPAFVCQLRRGRQARQER